MAKPFIAARIPQNIADHLETRCQQDNVGKTEIIINALAQYLGCSIENPIETNAIDRLATLEEKVKHLEALVNESYKADNKTEKNNDKRVVTQLEFVKSSSDNSSEKDIDKKVGQLQKALDKESDNTLLASRELSELTSVKFSTVRSRFRRKQSFEHNGTLYQPVEGSKPQSWKAETIIR